MELNKQNQEVLCYTLSSFANLERLEMAGLPMQMSTQTLIQLFWMCQHQRDTAQTWIDTHNTTPGRYPYQRFNTPIVQYNLKPDNTQEKKKKKLRFPDEPPWPCLSVRTPDGTSWGVWLITDEPLVPGLIFEPGREMGGGSLYTPQSLAKWIMNYEPYLKQGLSGSVPPGTDSYTINWLLELGLA